MIETPVSASPRAIAHCTGAAPRYFGRSDLRQERPVDVHRAVGGELEEVPPEDPAVGGDAHDVGAQRRELRREPPVADLLRLQHGDAPRPRPGLGRGLAERLAAAGGAVRLRDDREELVAGARQRVERGDGERGRAHEDDAHARCL
jgi:hypothetical protein